MENTLKHIEPVKVSPRTKLTVTYYFKEYDVSVDYVATIEYKEKDKDARIAKLPGRWSGRIHVDEISDVDLEETNLDTQQSVKKKSEHQKCKSIITNHIKKIDLYEKIYYIFMYHIVCYSIM